MTLTTLPRCTSNETPRSTSSGPKLLWMSATRMRGDIAHENRGTRFRALHARDGQARPAMNMLALKAVSGKPMNPPPAEIGAPVADIDTPALIVDLDALDRNIAKMAEFARATGVRVRPHAKTHKSAGDRAAADRARRGRPMRAEGRRGRSAGARRRQGHPGEQPGRRRRASCAVLRALAQDATIALCFDSAEQVDAASRVAKDFGVELGALVEIEVGMERCGVAPGKAAAALARRIADAPNLTFRGLQAYHGRAQHLPTHQQRAPGDRVGGRCGARDARRAEGRQSRPARSWPAPAPAPSRSRRRAASTTSCRSAHTCSWTPTTPGSATRTAASTPRSSTACSCSPR